MSALTEKDTGAVVDEMNSRLKALGGKPLAVDRPEMLGALFRKTDAMGWAMLMVVKDPDSEASVTMAMASALLRLKQRMVFAYIYAPYESPDTMASLRIILDTWTDRILSANK